MHRSGSFIRLTSVFMDIPRGLDDSSAQITWLFLLTIWHIEIKNSLGVETGQEFLIQSITYSRSDIHKARSGL